MAFRLDSIRFRIFEALNFRRYAALFLVLMLLNILFAASNARLFMIVVKLEL